MADAMKERPVALITGASSGFGMLAAVALAEAGYRVVATMRSLYKNGELLERAAAAGVSERMDYAELDVTKREHIERVVLDVAGRYGRIDALINNAGYAVMGMIEEVPMQDWREQLETNFFGTVGLTKAVLPYMRAQRSGAIVNVSSGAGRMGFPNTGAYSASKFAVEGFSEALRFELQPFGVRVVLIEPGTYNTGIANKHVYHEAPDSPYAPMIRSFRSYNEKAERSAGDPAVVARTIVRAVQARRPRMRYVCGADAKSIVIMRAMLPWSWIERIIAKML
ncbi:SDR family oxidoreductase [Paenibacillus sp. MBLB4367]|uniref:SDR family oxidoreductase n=1 Tax=Paenibacillus sp. MBLB4367 TaxID=3384767 RepID=UPI00390814ED